MSPELQAKIDESMAILDQAVAENDPVAMVGLFSGGHDSYCSTHVASQHERFSGAGSFDTTIGIQQTIDWRRERCVEHQWRQWEYVAPVSYRDIVLQNGFPGPGGHLYMYTRLKERCLDQMMRDIQPKRGARVLLVTGVRLSESKRRMGHVKPIARKGGRVWVAPILNWTDDDKAEYMAHHHLSRNPVVDTLCMSGECLCGAFASPGEIAVIGAAFPEMAATIREIELEARTRGVHSVWGTRPPGSRKKASNSGDMCFSCAEKFSMTKEDWDLAFATSGDLV